MNYIFRILNLKDVEAYRALRLRSYQEAPFAFSESYKDERHRSLEDFAREVTSKGNPAHYFMLGIFNEQQ